MRSRSLWKPRKTRISLVSPRCGSLNIKYKTTSFDQLLQGCFFWKSTSLSVQNFCEQLIVLNSNYALFGGQLVPVSWLKRFHPVCNFQKVCEIVTHQVAALLCPWQVCNTSHLVNSIFYGSVVKQVKVVLWVSQGDLPWISCALLTSSHFENQIKVWWIFASLQVSWNLFTLEIIFREFSEVGNTI